MVRAGGEFLTPYGPRKLHGLMWPVLALSNGKIKTDALASVGVGTITTELLFSAGGHAFSGSIKQLLEKAEYETDKAHHGDKEATIVDWKDRHPAEYPSIKAFHKAVAFTNAMRTIGLKTTPFYTLVNDCVWQMGNYIFNKPSSADEVGTLVEMYRYMPPGTDIYSNTGIILTPPTLRMDEAEIYFVSAYLGRANFAANIDQVAKLLREPAQHIYAGGLRTLDVLKHEFVETPDFIKVQVHKVQKNGKLTQTGGSFISIDHMEQLIRATPDKYNDIMYASLGVVK